MGAGWDLLPPDVGIGLEAWGSPPSPISPTAGSGGGVQGKHRGTRRRSRRGYPRSALVGGNEGPSQLLRATMYFDWGHFGAGGSPFSSLLNPRSWEHTLIRRQSRRGRIVKKPEGITLTKRADEPIGAGARAPQMRLTIHTEIFHLLSVPHWLFGEFVQTDP